ncbi:MAG: SpoIID/LytB domain-containing protein [Desulfobacterales bacterium]
MCLLFILCVSPGLQASGFGSWDEDLLLTMGERLMNRGKYLEALGMFNEVVSHSKNIDKKSKALFLISQTESTYLDKKDSALKRFKSITHLYPGTKAASEALFQSGIIYFNQKKFQQAASAFREYIQKYPDGDHCKASKVWEEVIRPLIISTGKDTPPREKNTPSHSDFIPSDIRVLIKKQVAGTLITSQKQITVSDLINEKLIYSGWGPLKFTWNKKFLMLNGKTLPRASCRIASDAPAVKVDGVPYRGCLIISARPKSLELVNHLPLEQYLYGVVPKEMPDTWAEHALMAQAVAARTYALYIRMKNRHKPYDLESTTASQVYGGYHSESKRSTRAVDATRGKVITHDGKLIIAYFHSSSGGHTEDPANVWNTEEVPYLRGIPDRYSDNSPQQKWEYFLSYRDALRKLNEYGLDISRLDQLKIMDKSNSGRYRKVIVYSDKGVYPLSSNHFRTTIGETRLKSTLFQTIHRPEGILFQGKGYGHGVGMSQWGARRMAQAGLTYQEILKYYYRDIKIMTLKS